MNKTVGFFLALSLNFILTVGCTERSSTTTASVDVEIPALLPEMSITSAPATAANFTCILLNVTGPGIETIQGLGLVSSMVAASTGGTLTLQVPAGVQRLFQVIGVVSASSNCDTPITRQSLLSQTDYPAVAELGRELADISADTTLRIKGLYVASTAVDLRTGQLLSGGGSGGGGGGSPTPAPSLPTVSSCASAFSSFAGGAGTQGDPIRISTTTHWNTIGFNSSLYQDAACYFVLTADLDFAGSQLQFIPTLYAKIDGGGHTMRNGIVSRDSVINYGTGIVGQIYSGRIHDLIIDNFSLPTTSSFVAQESIGIVAGSVQATNTDGPAVENVTVQNSSIVTTAGTRLVLGGIVGNVQASSLVNVQLKNSTITVHVAGKVGGIAGSNLREINGATVENLTYTGTTRATDMFFIGGLVGYQSGPSASLTKGLVRNSTLSDPNTYYQSGDSGFGGAVGYLNGSSSNGIKRTGVIGLTINGASNLGGLVGKKYYTGVIQESFVEGTLNYSASSYNVGGAVGMLIAPQGFDIDRVHVNVTMTTSSGDDINAFVGYSDTSLNPPYLVNNYWNSSLSDANGSVAGALTPLTTSQFSNTSNFHSSWNFGSVWEIPSGYGYPVLQELGPW